MIKSRKRAIIFVLLIFVGLIFFTLYLCREAIGKNNSDSPNWYGIIPGTSTREDVVLLLGKADISTTTFLYRENLMYFGDTKFDGIPEERFAYLNITLFFGKVVSIRETLNVTYSVEHDYFPDRIFEEKGIPEKLLFEKNVGAHAILYCESGVIYFVGSKVVSEILYFSPRNSTWCTFSFSSILAKNPPKGWDVLVQRDPWGILGE